MTIVSDCFLCILRSKESARADLHVISTIHVKLHHGINVGYYIDDPSADCKTARQQHGKTRT